MARYLETLFRHRVLAGLVVLLSAAGGAGVAFMQPSSYTATAHIWFAGGRSDYELSTAKELIRTDAFAVTLAHSSPDLNRYLAARAANPPLTQRIQSMVRGTSPDANATQATATFLTSNVTVTILGPEILSVAATADDPNVAIRADAAVVAALADAETAAKTRTTQATVDLLTSQIRIQQQATQAADQDVANYVATHPDATRPKPAPDATLSVLQLRANQQHDAYTQLLQKLTQAQLDLASKQAGPLPFTVVDAPQSVRARSRLTTDMIGLIGGVIAGLFAVAAMVVAITAFDPKVRQASDLRAAVGADPVATIPIWR